MNLVILTTETLHHTYFVRELARHAKLDLIVKETRALQARFETHHPFERCRDDYERATFFGGGPVPNLDTFAPLLETESVNDPQCVARLGSIKPDLVIDFGTGKVSPSVIHLFPDRLVNLHGGPPERYRGLDSHLWAIYHSDFDALITTIHRLNSELDCGDILFDAALTLPPDCHLYQLRRYNTEMCLQLTLACVDMWRRHGSLVSRPQTARGRYYSFMPAALKDICVRRFDAYCSSQQQKQRKSA